MGEKSEERDKECGRKGRRLRMLTRNYIRYVGQRNRDATQELHVP